MPKNVGFHHQPPAEFPGLEVKCLRRQEPFQEGTSLPLTQAKEIQRRQSMMDGLLKQVLGVSVRDAISFRERDGHLAVECVGLLDSLITPEVLQCMFEDLCAFLHATEVVAAVDNVDGVDAIGRMDAAAHAADALDRLAQKRSVKGLALTDVFRGWLRENARACVQEFDVEVRGKTCSIRIPSKNRLAEQSPDQVKEVERILGMVKRASVKLHVIAILPAQGGLIVAPRVAERAAPGSGETAKIVCDEIKRPRLIEVLSWKSFKAAPASQGEAA